MTILQGPFGQVPTAAILDRDLPDYALRMLALLCTHANRNRLVDPAVTQIYLAEELGIAKQTASDHIKILVERGYVKKERGGFPARTVIRVLFDQPEIPERPYSPRAHRRREDGTLLSVSAPEAVTGQTATVSAPRADTEYAPRADTEYAPGAVTVPIRDSYRDSYRDSERAQEVSSPKEIVEEEQTPEPLPVVLYQGHRWPPAEHATSIILRVWTNYDVGRTASMLLARRQRRELSLTEIRTLYARWHDRELQHAAT